MDIQQPSWAAAANDYVATQLGRLTIENATLRAQSDAKDAEIMRQGVELSQVKAELEKAQKELTTKSPPESPPAPAKT